MASAAANAAFCTELVLNIPGGNDDLENNIEEANVNVPTHERGMKSIARVLGTVGLFTLAMDVRTALYKPPSGVVFGEYKLAYYVILAVIFAFGVGEHEWLGLMDKTWEASVGEGEEQLQYQSTLATVGVMKPVQVG
ncbi:hypothetical protein ZWY2020_031929 [Hordeum vulgare]|nr:hypothetical protein ZWY2020_031929 [Hordeum vulgare]